MNWLDNIPDLSIKKIALILSRIDFRDLNNGHLKFKLNQDVINDLLKDLIDSSEYIEDIRTTLYKDIIEVDIDLKLKGIYYSTRYLLTLESFDIHPGKHQIIFKFERKEKHSGIIEKIYDLTIKPFIMNNLISNGFRVNEPYLNIDLNNIEKIRSFKSSFIGTFLFANLNMRVQEFTDEGISFDIDVNTFKETIAIIKKSVESTLAEKTKESNKASA